MGFLLFHLDPAGMIEVYIACPVAPGDGIMRKPATLKYYKDVLR